MFLFPDRAANRAVETNEMWKAREKEIELENERRKIKSREESSSSSSSRMKRRGSFSKRSLDKRCSSSNDEKKFTHPLDDEDEGLGDDEIESFLQSRYMSIFYSFLLPFEFATASFIF